MAVVAEASAHRVVVAIGLHVAIAHRRTVPIVVPVVVAVVAQVPVVVVVVKAVVVISEIMVVVISFATILGRVGTVEVVSGIEAVTPVAVATLEGQEDCGTVEEHKPSLQLLLIVWTYFRLHQVFASITVMRHIPIIPKAMLIPVFLSSIFPINTGTMMTRAVRSIDKAMTKRRRLMFTVFRSSSLAVLYPAISQSPLPIISIMAATINAKLMIITTIILLYHLNIITTDLFKYISLSKQISTVKVLSGTKISVVLSTR